MQFARFCMLAGVLVLSACGPAATTSTSTTAAQPTAAAAPTVAPTSVAPTVAPTSVAPTTAKPAASGTQRLTLAPDGNEARFRAREVLARLRSPSDAVGKTGDVSGSINIGPNGVVAEGSKITVKLDSLATDERQRDRFIKSQTLET